jgi:hypothetical protein
MNNISIFLSVINDARCYVDKISKEKNSDYWDTIAAILIDKHFLNMVTIEMKNPKITWQCAVENMVNKCLKKLKRLRNDDKKEYVIELMGTCKLLIDKYGSSTAI